VTVLLTGFPEGFLAERLLEGLVARDPERPVLCVVPERLRERAEALLDQLGRHEVELLEGDVTHMDLGLSGPEFEDLAARVEVLHHAAAVDHGGASPSALERLHVNGTREVLELALSCRRLKRLVHWSTTLVAGDREGTVPEEALPRPRFRSPLEATRYAAERLVHRHAHRVPTTVLRPSTIVGDSRSGEVDRFDGPYLILLLFLSSPPELRLPLPAPPETPLYLVPIDHVVRAGLALGTDPRTVGEVLHIVDPAPPTVGDVFTAFARAAERPEPRRVLPSQLATTVLRTPGLERYAHVPRAFLDQLVRSRRYADGRARPLLEEHGLRCPAFADYVEALVAHTKARLDAST
jgi:nucleoside-diphosphate-sugar epimerase